MTLLAVAHWLAALRGDDCGGIDEAMRVHGSRDYFVPSRALTVEQARTLGIRGPCDLFGCVVPHAFVATHAVSHPLATLVASAPAGWNPAFAAQVQDTVLKGNTAFTPGDVRTAGRRLLVAGPVRVKPVHTGGGIVVHDRAALQRLVAAMNAGDIATHGVVIEEELRGARRYSVGQATMGQLTVSHLGAHRSIGRDDGEAAHRTCELTVVRGGFDELLDVQTSADQRLVIVRAREFDAALRSCFPGLFASRINYELLCGHDAAGRPRCGVLQPSWRVDISTAAEVAALELLSRRPACTCVHASGVEVFGKGPPLPANAIPLYQRVDPRIGPLTTYVTVA